LARRGSYALATIRHHSPVETGPAVEHHAAVQAAAALDLHRDHLLSAVGAHAALQLPSIAAAASTLCH
jgi:hypothetical protein